MRPRRDRDVPAVMNYVSITQQLSQQVEFLVRQPSPATDVQAEMLVFLGPITYSEGHRDPSAADDVEQAEVLSETNRIVERQDHRDVQR
jgi:hypothetical protein